MSTSISRHDLFGNGIILLAYVGLMSGYIKPLRHALSIFLTASKCVDVMYESAHLSFFHKSSDGDITKSNLVLFTYHVFHGKSKLHAGMHKITKYWRSSLLPTVGNTADCHLCICLLNFMSPSGH